MGEYSVCVRKPALDRYGVRRVLVDQGYALIESDAAIIIDGSAFIRESYQLNEQVVTLEISGRGDPESRSFETGCVKITGRNAGSKDLDWFVRALSASAPRRASRE